MDFGEYIGEQDELSANERIENLKTYEGPDRVVPVQEIADTIDDSKVPVYPTGIRLIDNNFEGGIEEGELVVVTGLSGHGKTTLLMTMTQNMKVPTVWFTLEVTPRQFIAKMKKRNPELPLFHMPMKNLNHDTDWITERVYEAIGKYGAKLIFIDHLHRILSPNETDSNASLRIGRVVNALKDIATEHNLIIVLVAHCRDLQKGEELHMSHIRDSGMIKNEADIVLGVYRVKLLSELGDPPSREMFTEQDNKSKLLVLKNRRTGLQGASFLIHEQHYLRDTTDTDL